MGRALQVVELEKDVYTVAAAATDRKGDPVCELIDFISDCVDNPKYRGYAQGIQDLLERFSTYGRDGLTSDQTHHADKANEIYQFKKGDLRVLYFYADEKSIVICSHGFIKKTQKADNKEVRKAVSLRKQYLESRALKFLDG